MGNTQLGGFFWLLMSREGESLKTRKDGNRKDTAMTSAQYPGFPPNGVPPQVPGQSSQVPPWYVVTNGRLMADSVKKTRRALVIGILAISLVLVLEVVLFILLFTGVLSLPGGSKAAGGSASASPDDVISGLTQSEKEPELIDMGNIPFVNFTFTGDLLLATDREEIWAVNIPSHKEIWRSADPIEKLGCDSLSINEYSSSFGADLTFTFMTCSSYETASYVVISTKDGKVVTSGKIESDEGRASVGLLHGGNLVACQNNEITRYDGVASTKKKLWSQPVNDCGISFYDTFSGWIEMEEDNRDGAVDYFWGKLFNSKDGSRPPFAQDFADSIEDLVEDAYSFTPLENGNYAAEYLTQSRQGGPTSEHSVLLNAKGTPLSQTYDNAFFASNTYRDTVVLLSIYDPNDFKVTKNIRLDPETGQELWTSEDAQISQMHGADKQFIWGTSRTMSEGGGSPDRSIIVDIKTGKAVPMDGLKDARDLYRTENGFITESNTDAGTVLKAYVWKDGNFAEVWSKTFKNVSSFVSHQNRLFALSSGDGNRIVGYLGYK